MRAAACAILVAVVGSFGIAIGAASAADAGRNGPTERIERQLAQTSDTDGFNVTAVVPPPKVSAKGWLVYDETAQEPIAARDATTPRPIASLAKLMTALLTVERAQQSDIVTIPRSINELPADAALMGLRAGEKWPLRDLLQGMLVVSANDAALALATEVSGDEAKFVDLMNERAEDLGLTNTRFASSTGLDLTGASSSSNPVDLLTLTSAALEDDDIAAAVVKEQLSLKRPGSATGAEPIELVHRHPLMGKYEGVDGVKTGFTDQAGYMLVTHFVDPKTKGRLVVVTAASTSEATRASDTRALLDWARPLRTDVLVAEGGEQMGSIPVLHRSKRIEVFVCDDALVSARVGQRIATSIVVPKMVEGPIRAGDELGELRISVAGADAVKVPLCAASGLKAEGRLGRIRATAGEYRSAWDAGTEEVKDAWQKLAG